MTEYKKCLHCSKTFWKSKSKFANSAWLFKKYCCDDCKKQSYKEKLASQGNPEPRYRLRFELFKRDNFKCFYCGRSPIEDGVVLEVEHVKPRHGVPADWNNAIITDLVTSCRDCNTGKRDRVLSLPVLKRINIEISKRT